MKSTLERIVQETLDNLQAMSTHLTEDQFFLMTALVVNAVMGFQCSYPDSKVVLEPFELSLAIYKIYDKVYGTNLVGRFTAALDKHEVAKVESLN